MLQRKINVHPRPRERERFEDAYGDRNDRSEIKSRSRCCIAELRLPKQIRRAEFYRARNGTYIRIVMMLRMRQYAYDSAWYTPGRPICNNRSMNIQNPRWKSARRSRGTRVRTLVSRSPWGWYMYHCITVRVSRYTCIYELRMPYAGAAHSVSDVVTKVSVSTLVSFGAVCERRPDGDIWERNV